MSNFRDWFTRNTIASPDKNFFLYRGHYHTEVHWYKYYYECVITGLEKELDSQFNKFTKEHCPQTDGTLYYLTCKNKYYTKWQLFDYWMKEIYIKN